MDRLRDAIHRIRDEWGDPRSTASFGLLTALRPVDHEDSSFEDGIKEVIHLLRGATIDRGLGSEGLRRLTEILRWADQEARAMTPRQHDWSPDELELRAEVEAGLSATATVPAVEWLTYESNFVLLEDWVYVVMYALDDLFMLLTERRPETLLSPYLLMPTEVVDELELEAEVRDRTQVIPFPPKRLLHRDVSLNVTPTNGPNHVTHAIETSVRACGDVKAA